MTEVPTYTQLAPPSPPSRPPTPTPPATVSNPTTEVPVPVASDSVDSVNDLFPGLPPFDSTDMTLADIGLCPEDLIPYPEELQSMLQAEEPVTDKRGGRPSSKTLSVVDAELATLDTKLNNLSKKTGISITNILKRWNTTKTRGSSLWNLYQKYFTANKAEELHRLGLDTAAKVTGVVRSEAYVAFRKEYPDSWPEVLEVWAQYEELGGARKTAQQRALAFRRTWRTICSIVSLYS